MNEVHSDAHFVTLHALRIRDQSLVMIVTTQSSYPSHEEIARLKNHYEILKGLNSTSILNVLELIRIQKRYYLVQEDFNGTPLTKLMVLKKFDLPSKVEICLQILRALTQIHSLGIIHKEIQPDNIIINSDTYQTKITGFGLAITAPLQRLSVKSPGIFDRFLPYISPEQTGRLNREIDDRTDIYSLGVIFYQIFTEKLPFEASDPSEWIHAHLAIPPQPPYYVNSEIPLVISNIIMKMMAKQTEERYQNVLGLLYDFEQCSNLLKSNNELETFPIATHDSKTRFQVSQKMYGREKEIDLLIKEFEQIISGEVHLVLVQGPSGIGKSSLVREIQQVIGKQKGFFITGKFDNLKINTPYSGFIEAFHDLIQQILTESEDKLAFWKQNLNLALNKNTRVMTDLIPELKLIIGEPAGEQMLFSLETINQFNLYFERFISVFANQETPLVIFLDDLEWIDSASLKLLDTIMTTFKPKHLLIIGAYRSEEVDPNHPLVEMLNRLETQKLPIKFIEMAPLDWKNVNKLIADTLHINEDDATFLSSHLIQKTQGNPLFIHQLFKDLYEEKILFFDPIHLSWKWNSERLQTLKVSDNVADLLVKKLQRCSPVTQQLLQLMSCLGNASDIQFLTEISKLTINEIIPAMREAIFAGLIIPTETAAPYFWKDISQIETIPSGAFQQPFRFLHDRILQAAYASIPQDKKMELHKRIGEVLLIHTPSIHLDQNIFNIVNHFSKSLPLIEKISERVKVAELNLQAAKRAMKSIAFNSALNYLQNGLNLLPEHHWERYHDLSIDLTLNSAECLFMIGKTREAFEQYDILEALAKTDQEKINIYTQKAKLHLYEAKYDETMEYGIKALDLLGFHIPTSHTRWHILKEFFLCKLKMAFHSYRDILEAPEINDPRLIAISNILSFLFPAAYLSNRMLLLIAVLKAVQFILKNGNTPISPYIFAGYGLITNFITHNYKEGYELGQLALELCARFPEQKFTASTQFVVGTFLLPYQRPIKEAIHYLMQGYEGAKSMGDWLFAIYCLGQGVTEKYTSGMQLSELEQEIRTHYEFVKKMKAFYRGHIFLFILHTTLALQNKTKSPWDLSTDDFDEERAYEFAKQNNFLITQHIYLTFKLELTYLFGEYDLSMKYSALSEELGFDDWGQTTTITNLFYRGLAILQKYPTSSNSEKRVFRKKLTKYLKTLHRFAKACPANFGHKYLLLQAEIARVFGRFTQAIEYYDKAIESASINEFTNMEALANELVAKFYLSIHKPRLAKHYLQDAHYAYEQWGCIAKVQDLDKHYQHLLPPPTPLLIGQVTTSNPEAVDMNAFIKASQSISQEIVLPKLLDQMMRIVIENAGAQKAFMILIKDSKPFVEAEYDYQHSSNVILTSEPIEDRSDNLPVTMIYYVMRTKENVTLEHGMQQGIFSSDRYFLKNQPHTILCFPLATQGKLKGILYLENKLTEQTFPKGRIETLNLLTTQIATALENAMLYQHMTKLTEDLKISHEKLSDYALNLERKVHDRTKELRDKNQKLQETIQQIKEMQKRLIEQEKLLSLSSATKHISKELRSPLSYTHNFAILSQEYLKELGEKLGDRQDLKKLVDQVQTNIQKIEEHSQKADAIVLSLEHIAQEEKAQFEQTDLNKLIKDYAALVYDSYYSKDPIFSLNLETDYDATIEPIMISSKDIGKVFYHIIDNACYATNQKKKSDQPYYSPKLTIQTKNEGKNVKIRIWDNGTGISPEIAQRLFSPFVSTKPSGTGAGMGLSISHDIIVDEHGGTILVDSRPGEYTSVEITLPKIKE